MYTITEKVPKTEEKILQLNEGIPGTTSGNAFFFQLPLDTELKTYHTVLYEIYYALEFP